jgi:hypothetical protein
MIWRLNWIRDLTTQPPQLEGSQLGKRNAWLLLGALAAIVMAAILLRFVDLAANPGGLFGDEASEGLDAARLRHQPGFHADFGV